MLHRIAFWVYSLASSVEFLHNHRDSGNVEG